MFVKSQLSFLGSFTRLLGYSESHKTMVFIPIRILHIIIISFNIPVTLWIIFKEVLFRLHRHNPSYYRGISIRLLNCKLDVNDRKLSFLSFVLSSLYPLEDIAVSRSFT